MSTGNTLNVHVHGNLKTRPGEHLRLFEGSVDADNRFHDVVFSKKDNDDASFLTTRDRLIDLATCKQYISSRFANFNDDPVLKAAASMTEPFLWPSDREALLVYGGDHLHSLINGFGHLVHRPSAAFDELICKEEWLELKLHYNRGGLRLPAKQFWQELLTNPHYSARCPNLLVVIELCLVHVMPIQIACRERGNSCLNRIMTDFRSIP